MKKFPFYRQLDAMDCGPTCLRMIARHYGKIHGSRSLRERSFLTRDGVSLLAISETAESIGFRTLMAKITFHKLQQDAPLPLIVHWRQRHFVVVYHFHQDKVKIADPAHGLITLTTREFLEGWIGPGQSQGVALFLETTPAFYEVTGEKADRVSLAFIFNYLKPYRRFLIQLLLGMLAGSFLQLLFPFLTQAMVDVGIQHQNINFVHLVLIGQLVLFFSRTAVDFIRSWILLHIGTRLNIALLSDFLIKLMKLPIAFFNSKMIGDLLQRIGDHRRIETFLTSSVLTVVFSTMNLFIFGLVLAYYNLLIFQVFVLGSGLYTGWILLFMKRRRVLDYKLFDQMATNQNGLIQLFTGMQEIKLHNCERQKRWEWERVQAQIYRVSLKTLALNQYQQAGSVFINEVKNILITFLAAKSVVAGEITLGMMLAVQYIIGQLNAPIVELIGFIRTAQDAQISLERLGEIHSLEEEELPDARKLRTLPTNRTLTLQQVSFQYDGPRSPQVLDQVALTIAQGKVTAIVGASGSGKTTLLKLLLRFYEPTQGLIQLGNRSLSNYSNPYWREQCGAVMQDGFIFSDTIARNIAVSDEYLDDERLRYAVKVANIQEYIESLAMGLHTKIGADGIGLSQGQKQRILIARAVYKDPAYLFFDEATNALDASNERVIIENLNHFFQGRTVVVVAHRLSTVVNADQIVVLEQGRIVERGNHRELASQQGVYYNLVKNQLELGS